MKEAEPKGELTEFKFPQDYDVEELVERNRQAPWFDEHQEQRIRDDHRLRSRGVAGVLADVAKDLRGDLPEEFHEKVNQRIADIAVMLDGSLPDTRWAVSDYIVEVVSTDGKVTIDEHTRPHNDILAQYWKEVNN